MRYPPPRPGERPRRELSRVWKRYYGGSIGGQWYWKRLICRLKRLAALSLVSGPGPVRLQTLPLRILFHKVMCFT